MIKATAILSLIIILISISMPLEAANIDPRTSGFVIAEITVGNHSFVSLKFVGKPGDEINAPIILDVLDKFEHRHPEFEIAGWHMEYDQDGYGRNWGVLGIWIDHKPKGICK